MIHKGKALMYEKEFDKAIDVFENAKKADPNKSNMIDGKVELYLKDIFELIFVILEFNFLKIT